MMMEHLVIEGLTVRRGLSTVLSEIALEAGAGEIVGIFGRNGVGKTSLLQTIAGWLLSDAGSIRIDGVNIAGWTADRIGRTGVGFIPEDRRIFGNLTVRENLHLGRWLNRKISSDEFGRRVDNILAEMPHLKSKLEQGGATLSGGEQQMLSFARILVAQPELLLIDEPTEGLAPMIIDEIFNIIRLQKELGRIVLLVEQNISRALDIVDRFYLISRGRVVYKGSSDVDEDRSKLFDMARI